ncbi:MAG: hypothetical protein LBG83_03675 [Oscillospiraceae bacterium]|jgi:hypothetical protein|nr:hypothetical protein [Oscillospiraceae bacterium]
MKRLLAVLLAAVLTCGALGAVTASAEELGDYLTVAEFRECGIIVTKVQWELDCYAFAQWPESYAAGILWAVPTAYNSDWTQEKAEQELDELNNQIFQTDVNMKRIQYGTNGIYVNPKLVADAYFAGTLERDYRTAYVAYANYAYPVLSAFVKSVFKPEALQACYYKAIQTRAAEWARNTYGMIPDEEYERIRRELQNLERVLYNSQEFQAEESLAMDGSWAELEALLQGNYQPFWDFVENNNLMIPLGPINTTEPKTLNNNGVSVTGILDDGVTLVVTEDTTTVVDGKLKAYHIVLKKNNVEVQPDGTLSVKLPIPAGVTDKTKLKVYRIESSGATTDMNATVEGDYLVFTTDHFSVYAIVATGGSADPGNNPTPSAKHWWKDMALWLKILLSIVTLGIVPLIGILTDK